MWIVVSSVKFRRSTTKAGCREKGVQPWGNNSGETYCHDLNRVEMRRDYVDSVGGLYKRRPLTICQSWRDPRCGIQYLRRSDTHTPVQSLEVTREGTSVLVTSICRLWIRIHTHRPSIWYTLCIIIFLRQIAFKRNFFQELPWHYVNFLLSIGFYLKNLRHWLGEYHSAPLERLSLSLNW